MSALVDSTKIEEAELNVDNKEDLNHKLDLVPEVNVVE